MVVYPLPELTGKIKKFIHSYLSVVKKEEIINKDRIVSILIKNGMFEELVNYNFDCEDCVSLLWDYTFTGSFSYNICFSPTIAFKRLFWVTHDPGSWQIEKIKELLFSWDKVENRHALATLWTLLAKRGILEKIFIKKSE